jgi:predicted Fe-Mo cluster-binding NifX family protein
MRIAVSAQGKDLSSAVDPRFGRASYFLVYDTDDETVEVVDNGPNVQAAQGAGIQAAESIARKNVELVVAGSFGPKAFQALEAAGIKAARWTHGTVAEAIEMARNYKLDICHEANVEGHWA